MSEDLFVLPGQSIKHWHEDTRITQKQTNTKSIHRLKLELVSQRISAIVSLFGEQILKAAECPQRKWLEVAVDVYQGNKDLKHR